MLKRKEKMITGRMKIAWKCCKYLKMYSSLKLSRRLKVTQKINLLVKCAKTTDMYLSTATATVEKVEPARNIFKMSFFRLF